MGNNLTRNGLDDKVDPDMLAGAGTSRALMPFSQDVPMHIEHLPNDIWIEIMTYLSFRDLQQLRLVSWRCRELVNRRYFTSKGKVIVTNKNLSAMKAHVERGVSYLHFDDVELRNMTQSHALSQFLKMVGPEVKQMEVRHAPVFHNMNGKLPNLKVLKIVSTSLLDDVNMTIDGINMKQFKHLTRFECDGISLDGSLKMLMLKQLRRRENKVRLRHLQFEYRQKNETALLEVLYDHAPSLQCVDLFFSCSPGIETLPWRAAFKRMHNLRNLKLSGNCHFVLLNDILDAIPESSKLEDLDLTGMLSLTSEILINIVAHKWHKTLRSLDVMFCVQLDVQCVSALRMMNGFLESLTLSFCRRLTGRGLVEGLTTQVNYTLQELFLEDVCFIDETSMCILMERLPNLRKLSLDNCKQATTDRTLSTIFRHQTMLRLLRIDNCIKVTDMGFIGFGSQPAPISRLRGLNELNVRGCHNLTDRLLKRGLCLPELKNLTLDYCDRLEANGIAALSVNCPALETLSVASCSLINDDAVGYIAANLKRLRSLTISNCSKLTLKAFKYIAKNARNLRDLVACTIDGLNHDAALKILARQLPELKHVTL